MTSQDFASQLDLYADGWETQRLAHKARYDEYCDQPGEEARAITWYEIAKQGEAEMAIHQLRNAARMVREFLVPKWTKTVPTEPGFYLRRFSKDHPIYIESYVLNADGVLCYEPSEVYNGFMPIGPKFQASTEWCPIIAPVDP